MRKCLLVRKDERGVSPVIATILMVAITVVLAAVLYVMVTGLLAGPGATKPNITFGGKEPITSGFQFQVAGASLVRPISSYRVNMLLNGTSSTSGATALAASMPFTLSGQAYTLTYSDVGGEGNVGPGDRFQLTRNTGQLWQTATYTAILLWTDGSEVGSLQYP